MKGKSDNTSKDRSIFDQKCVTCGSWMKRTECKNPNGSVMVSYSCPECGLSYQVEK